MKVIFGIICLNFFVFTISAQEKVDSASTQHKENKHQLVEASCGQCNFDLPGDGCDLAVRIDGKAYFVDGTNIDAHGDAHASDGFCIAIRKAEVEGSVVDNRFKLNYFKLVALEEEKKEKK